MTSAELAARIDQTLLAPTATPAQVEALCAGAREYRFRAVCVAPSNVPLVVRRLEDSGVRVGTVAGFPLGGSTPAAKAWEAEEAVRAGAADVDMVINIGRLKAGDLDYVREEVRGVVRTVMGTATHIVMGAATPAAEKVVVKVIIEACYLTDEEKVAACHLAEEAGAHFVKTSTGFGPGGATPEDVRLIRRTVGDRLGVKASGGIRTLEQALALLEAGADVLGTSTGGALMAAVAPP